MLFGGLLAALSGITYGSIGYFGRTLMDLGLSVPDLLFWRFFASCLLLVPFLLRRVTAKERSALVQLLLWGGFFYGVSTLFYFSASEHIGTGLAMVIFYAYPIGVVGLSLYFHRTRLGLYTALALVLIVAGCALIASDGDAEFGLMGIGLSILSGAFYAVYVFKSKALSAQVSSAAGSFVVCAGCALVSALYAVATEETLYWPTSWEVRQAIVLFALIGTVLPLALLLLAMRRISASKAAIISVLEPVTTLLVGSIWLFEPVTMLQWAGSVVILGSAVLVQFEKD